MNPKIKSNSYKKLFQTIFDLYNLEENKSKLLFHGWHHIKFVHDKSIEFAEELSADLEIVASAALVHDLNYIFSDKLEPETANAQIEQYLLDAGFEKSKVDLIVVTIKNAHMGYRGTTDLSNEAKSLSDADSLFKVLPTTPILFASKFFAQNKYNIEKLANKVVSEQEELISNGTYFYTQTAKNKYLHWAKTNLEIWKQVRESLQDKDVVQMLKNATDLGVL